MAASGAGARNGAVDILRLVAFAAVVLIHSGAQIPNDMFGRVFLLDATRFAVPSFFVLSGYFSSANAPWWGSSLKLLHRLSIGFVLWFLIYNYQGLISAFGDLPIHEFVGRVFYWLWTGGNGWQLWFVPALIIATFIVSLCLRRLGIGMTGAIVSMLYLGALVLGPYSGVLFGDGVAVAVSRNGIFFAPVYVFAGVMLRQYRSRLEGKAALFAAVAVLGWLVHYTEARLVYGPDATGHDFFAGTLIWSVGLCGAAVLSNLLSAAWLSELALASYGAYLAHMFVLRGYWMQFGHDSVVGQLVVTVVVSLLGTVIYRRVAAAVRQSLKRGA